MRSLQAVAIAACVGAVLMSVAPVSQADVRLPAIFGDHMVLQRDMPIRVWGWADPAEKVTVKIGHLEGSVTADARGKWRVELDPLKTVEPLEVTVRGKNTVILKDVLAGDVWFCSGQSNMYWPVKNSADAPKEIAAAKWPQIRSFEVAKDAGDKPRDDVYGQWQVCSPATAGNFSAAAYYFARHLHTELKVPIGLIHSSWAASSAHPWTSHEGLAADAKVKAFADSVMKQTGENLRKFREEFEPQWAEWQKAAAAARAEGKQLPRRPEVSFRNEVRHVPSALYNGMVAPVTPLNLKGVIWYQGENDAHRGMFYQTIFEALIRDWRRQWRQEKLPFLFVQLANYQARRDEPTDSKWAELRAAQSAALRLPATGMACIIDIGEADNIHPRNKQDVGLRLALAGLHAAYGRQLVYSGPVLKGMKTSGNKAAVTFNHVGGGLIVKGGDELKGFAVAGPDRKFVGASARITGDKVIVSSDEVGKIAAVRYAWADNPECNLYNSEGLPAVPFRTDDW